MLKRTSKQLSMFSSLEDMLSHEHPLFQLSNKINWECFENAYYQYFCGGLEFMPKQPCDASELVHFRNRIGEKGMELILAESYESSFVPYKKNQHRACQYKLYAEI